MKKVIVVVLSILFCLMNGFQSGFIRMSVVEKESFVCTRNGIVQKQESDVANQIYSVSAPDQVEKQAIQIPSKEGIEKIITQLIDWKKTTVGATQGENLFNSEFLKFAGSTAGDWYPIGLGRYGYPDNYLAYLATITENINSRYAKPEKLDKVKATEWHRIALAVLAMGGDPTKIGLFEGKAIDLIADGVYDRGITLSLGRQGINGWIWGLIALDSQRFNIPTNAYTTRSNIIQQILNKQLSDGGFALSGTISDPDITAMAMLSLTPYYNSEVVYTVSTNQIADGDKMDTSLSKTVKQVIDECVNWLAQAMTPEGDYASFGIQNVESTAQVVTALTSLGIDLFHDRRFIKNGRTLWDGMMQYRIADGGFIHSKKYDSDNPTSQPNQSNSMAGSQVLGALVSVWREIQGMRTFYDMRLEFTNEELESVACAVKAISALQEDSSLNQVEQALQAYELVSPLNRCYVRNYWNLSRYAKKYALVLPSEDVNWGGNTEDQEDVLLYFSASDRSKVDELPAVDSLTTEYVFQILDLKYRLEHSEKFVGSQTYQIKLDNAYRRMIDLQREIEALNAEIRDKLYPIDQIGLKDKVVIKDLLSRYENLSAYDRTKITYFSDLVRSNTKIVNLTTAVLVSSVCGVLAMVFVLIVVLRARNRMKAKQAKAMLEREE